MSHKIELPDAVHAALQDAARANGTTPAEWIAAHLPAAENGTHSTRDDWIDYDFLKTYADETDDSISLETVRREMAKIPGRLADDIRAERDAR